MAAAKGSSIDLLCSCYKVPGLKDPILETPHISYLEDRYSLGEQLGWGQFGVIRACSDLLTGEALACKSIAKDRLASADDLVGVKLEIEVMARLSGHPNIVGLKAVYEDDARVHLVMELCAGGELFHRLEQHGCFPEPEAAVLFRPLMEVVMYCHDKGVVHRDLKPENILLATKSSSSPIKLADFGLATYIKPGQSLYGTVGSPFYIAPEVLAGAYNQAADVWSAGVILYILLSGMPPFWGKTKSRIFDSVRSADLRFPSDPWDHVSESAKELVAGMLCRDPVQRMTAEQVLGHPWMKDRAHHQLSPIQYVSERSLRQLSPPSRDASFTSPVPFRTHPEPSSPTFTCRSSFSSFLLDPPPPVTGFSFCSSCEPDDLTFSSPAPAIPTFEFFHRPSSNGHDDHQLDFTLNEAKSVRVQRDSSFGKLFGYPAPCIRGPEHMEAEGRRALATASRAINGIRSKRHHTIGLGELEQLDLIVSESVIRWASCNLPSALSLKSSLVC